MWLVVLILSHLKLSFALESTFYLGLDNRQVVALIGAIELLSLHGHSLLVLPVVNMLCLFEVLILLESVELLLESLLCYLIDAVEVYRELLVAPLHMEVTEALGLLLLHKVRVAAGAVLLGDLLSLESFSNQVAQMFRCFICSS